MSDLSIYTAGVSATLSALELALQYAADGFAVFPVFPVDEPAPPDIVAEFDAGRLTKKQAQAHAVCACGASPCTSPGKHPIIGDGVNGASLDPDVIRGWWTEAPDANVGIRMPLGTFAVDFDFYVDGARERYDALVELGLPPTLAQKSGANGLHCIYNGAPEDFAFSSTLDEQSGVDIIHNSHRYLVAAPSRHWTGGVYAWANGREIAAAPTWLLDRCKRGSGRKQKAAPASKTKAPTRQPGSPQAFGERIREAHANRRIPFATRKPPNVPVEVWAVTLAATMPPAISDDEEGSTEPGHVTLSRAACALIALGLTHDEALEVLRTHYNPRCVPSWEGDNELADFERTVRAAGRDIAPDAATTQGQSALLRRLATRSTPSVRLPIRPNPSRRCTSYAKTSASRSAKSRCLPGTLAAASRRSHCCLRSAWPPAFRF